MLFVAALVSLPSSAIGAPYPGAELVTAPEQQRCYTRYRLSTNAGISQVANFYMAEASRAGVPLFDDTKVKFPNYRTLTFIAEPKFMFVVLDRKDDRTTVAISYRTSSAANCR